MPIYEYACTDCGGDFEVMQKVTDRRKPACEHCDSRKVERKLSLSAFALKGDGWYKDLYGNKKSAGTEGKSEGTGTSESKTETSGSAGSESKPEKSGESKAEKKADTKAKSSPSSAPAA